MLRREFNSPLLLKIWGVVQARPNNFASCSEKRGSIPLHSTSSIIIEELINRIKEFEEKYNNKNI